MKTGDHRAVWHGTEFLGTAWGDLRIGSVIEVGLRRWRIIEVEPRVQVEPLAAAKKTV